jgi:hypothetical protein
LVRSAIPAALLLAASAAACAVRRPAAEEEGLFRFDVTALDERTRAKVVEIQRDPSSIAPLRETRVRSRREVYRFLFENLDFAAACARAIDKGTYRIERTGEGFRLDDGEGMTLELRRIVDDTERWVFLCVGTFGTFLGDILVVIHARPERGVLVTRGVVYLRLEGGSRLAADLMPRFVRTLMQRKGALFIEAATAVVEAAAADPAGFAERMRAAPEVDPAALENFRRTLVR